MSDRDLDQIIDDVLDGVAPPAESVWLKERMDRDPAIRTRYGERAVLFKALTPGEMVAPPPDLVSSVMSEIRGSSPAQHSASPTWWSSLLGSLTRRPALGLGYAFGAGAAIGVLAMVALTPRSGSAPSTPLPVNGTMVPPTGPNWILEDHARLAAGPGQGEVRLQRNGAMLIVEIESASRTSSRWTLEFDPASIRIMGIDRTRGPDGAFHSGSGRLELDAGAASLTRVRLESVREGDAELRLSLQVGDAVGVGTLRTSSHTRASP